MFCLCTKFLLSFWLLTYTYNIIFVNVFALLRVGRKPMKISGLNHTSEV
jgi:hypothetical protein